MSQPLQIGVLIALAVLAANLPFASQRLFLLGPVRQPKGLAWRLKKMQARSLPRAGSSTR